MGAITAFLASRMRAARPSTHDRGIASFSIRCRLPSPQTMKPCVGVTASRSSIRGKYTPSAPGVKARPGKRSWHGVPSVIEGTF